MKRGVVSVLVVALVLTAGCAEAPWGQPNPSPPADEPNQSEPSQPIYTNATNADYVFGESATTVQSHSVKISNNQSSGRVEVMMYMETPSGTQEVSEQIQSGESLLLQLRYPTMYAIEIMGSATGDYIIQEGQFDCNSKQHLLEVANGTVSSRMVATTLACSEE